MNKFSSSGNIFKTFVKSFKTFCKIHNLKLACKCELITLNFVRQF